MKKRVISTIMLFFVCSILSGWYGSKMSGITGTVVLPDGSAVPGVEVILTDEGDVKKTTVTSEEGNYRFLNLYPGIYQMQFRLEGFKPVIIKGIILEPGKRERVNAQIETTTIKEEIVITWSRHSRRSSRARRHRQKAASPSYSTPSYQTYTYTPPPQFNTEEYDRIYENRFLKAVDDPLSTFSIDVDTASYANVRRFIKGNGLPPKDAVRIEEMINYFNYDYPQPANDTPFSIVTEISSCPWNLSHKLAHIGLQGKKIATDELPPSNLVFLLDVSGSMGMPDKLPLLKSAFKLLVKNLDDKDRVAIVVYAGAAGLVLDSTPGYSKKRIIGAIKRLDAGGSTAGGAGIRLAYRVAVDNFIEGGNNRVILATDGDFNIGVSSTSELVRMIEKKREKGVFLTVLGFGMGNYKDSRMEQLADKGNGNYYYIDNILEAKKVFVSEMGATLFTIAKDVKIQVEFNPAKVKAYKLIGYENRMLNKEDFNDDKKDAGELGAGHTVTALYEIIPAGAKEKVASVDNLKYQETRIKSSAGESDEIMTVKFRYKEPDGKKSKLIVKTVKDEEIISGKTSDNFKFSAAVAQFGLLLRDSRFKGKSSYKSVLRLARSAKGKDYHGYRAEFIRLVEMSKLMSEAVAKE